MDLYASFEIACDLPTLSTGGAGSYYSGNANVAGTGTWGTSQVYDTAAAGSPAAQGPSGAIGGPLLHDFGRGRRLLLNVQIVTTYLATGGGSSMQVGFVADDDANGTNRNVLMLSADIAKAALVKGYRYPFGSTPGRVYNAAATPVPARYVYMKYIFTTNVPTTGLVSSWLSLDIDDHADIFGGL